MNISEMLKELDHGRTHERLSEELSEVIEAVSETGQPGVLTIKLTVKREGSQAMVELDSTPKVPKHPHHGSLYFFSKRPGRLTRQDERQTELRMLHKQEVRQDDGE